jgi:hypothetical protein
MAAEEDVRREPVTGFGRFQWRTGRWLAIFDRQVDVIRRDLKKAHAEDRVVIYLSCPVTGRGGGHAGTNVEIANVTARRLMHRYGDRVFVLNPAAYQLESREGTGLVLEHIRALFGGVDAQANDAPDEYLTRLRNEYEPQGGDYMRMWIRVLAEDQFDILAEARRGLNCGGLFDAFYFLGPTDVAEYFRVDFTGPTTPAVETYFARKYATDLEFRTDYDFSGRPGERTALDLASDAGRAEWEQRRKDFFRFYSVRASANFSKGCRDEWNTLVRLNGRRRIAKPYGPSEEIAAYFDGAQVAPGCVDKMGPRGYELSEAEP